ncbi:MAG TPA: helix-turn-helix transcriptional regulator [Marmoricola sp.]|nr:helix-turn-helix transcriptional regulator [Marmoricola sp.]
MGEVIRFPARSPANGSASPGKQPAPLWREAAGRELRRERSAQQRTLADVAGQAGVSTQYLSEVERGRKEPSSEVITAIGDALGFTLVDLTERIAQSLRSRMAPPSGPVALAA